MLRCICQEKLSRFRNAAKFSYFRLKLMCKVFVQITLILSPTFSEGGIRFAGFF